MTAIQGCPICGSMPTTDTFDVISCDQCGTSWSTRDEPRYVVKSASDAAWRPIVAYSVTSTPVGREAMQGVADRLNAGLPGRVASVVREAPWDRIEWVVVDTQKGACRDLREFLDAPPAPEVTTICEPPRPLPEGCVLDTSKPQAGGGEVPYTSYARLQQHRREVLGEPLRSAPSPAPPTDEEIVAAMDEQMMRNDASRVDRPAGLLCVGDRMVTVAAARAARSRVLAAKVRASDEQRRRDAMVYGPIDDPEES